MVRICAGLLALVWAGFAAAQPPGWTLLKITDDKKPTVYEAVDEGGRNVLHAIANGTASMLARRPDFNLRDRPLLSWRWKINRLVASADNATASLEDSPVRILLAFAGNKWKLAPRDRAVIRLSGRMSSKPLPYATLQYIWSNKSPPGSVIENPHTRRVQMIVASSGNAGVGEWQTIERDVAADYRRAFGEEPGKLLGYGIMSDTDNTGESVEAWYADIEFKPR